MHERPGDCLVDDLLEVAGAELREGRGGDQLELALGPSLVVILGGESEDFLGKRAGGEDGVADAKNRRKRRGGAAESLRVESPSSGGGDGRKVMRSSIHHHHHLLLKKLLLLLGIVRVRVDVVVLVLKRNRFTWKTIDVQTILEDGAVWIDLDGEQIRGESDLAPVAANGDAQVAVVGAGLAVLGDDVLGGRGS